MDGRAPLNPVVRRAPQQTMRGTTPSASPTLPPRLSGLEPTGGPPAGRCLAAAEVSSGESR
jgi:hypothetical protein